MADRIPAELMDQIVDPDIVPGRTAALSTLYYRNLARRLSASLGREFSGQRVVWLHPRYVWAATQPGGGGETGEDVARALATASEVPPAVEHLLGQPADSWLRSGLERLRSDVDEVFSEVVPTVAASVDHVCLDNFREAASILRRVWPAAAFEYALLIRAIVFIEGDGWFRSATVPDTFGTIYVSVGSAASTPAAFETILHETGHHSLYLRNMFQEFVTNGDKLVSHALRPDPRPIRGTLHAAHVLTRMAVGFTRWCKNSDAPADADVRRDDAILGLGASLGVLEEHAEWTPPGKIFFENLMSQYAALTSGSIAWD